MNTQHLQYIIEIERTRSISQAAENLFIGQPNLSRILHDVEQMLGFRIFERSTRGVRPTTRGTIFLQHAKSILRETEAIEALELPGIYFRDDPERVRAAMEKRGLATDAVGAALEADARRRAAIAEFEAKRAEQTARQAAELRILALEAEIARLRGGS